MSAYHDDDNMDVFVWWFQNYFFFWFFCINCVLCLSYLWVILVFLSWSLVYPRLGCKDLCQQSFFFSCSFSSTLTCHYLSRVQQYFPSSFSLLWIGSSLFSLYSDILTACGCSLDVIICVRISSDSCCCSSAEPSRPGPWGLLRTNQCTLWMAENWYAQGTLWYFANKSREEN